MAVLKAPLLSIDARGKFANAIVFSGWKGLKVARQHVVPANPKTAAQIIQRDFLAAVVSAWKNHFLGTEGREAWDRSALNDSRPMSGFNMFSSQALHMIQTDADASFCDTMTETAAQKVTFGMENLDDGVAGDEAGNFEIWVGSTISGMTLSEEVAIVAGDVVGTVDLGDVDDVVYCKVRKDSYDRSGIFKATLIA